jgi:hypothetical protein
LTRVRFALSYRDVEDMLAERGIDASYETVRRWALKFGAIIARKLRRGRLPPARDPPHKPLRSAAITLHRERLEGSKAGRAAVMQNNTKLDIPDTPL